MATTVPLGDITDVTLAGSLAVEQISNASSARWLILWPPVSGGQLVDVYIVTKAGATVADEGRLVQKASIDTGFQFDISPFGFLGLAGSAAGTVRVELR